VYNRRQVVSMGLGSLASISLFGLAGCDTPTQAASQQTSTLLKMFFWGSATRDKLTKGVINLFQQGHKGTTITSQISGNDTYYTKLDAQIASGNAPDLIQMDMRYIAHYVRTRTLLDLSQYIYNQTIDLADFDPVLLNSSKVNNTIYGIPLGSNYFCMFCDKTQIEKTSLGPVPTNLTWQTFAEYATELTNALGNGIYGSADKSGNYDVFETWIRQRGKELYTQDGALNFELADVADWYSYWDNLRKTNACPPTSIQATLDLTGTPTDSSVIKGKAVFGSLFTNQFEAFHTATPHDLALFPYPKGSVPGSFLKASLLLSISETTKYPVFAAKFISFCFNDAGAVKVLGFERGVPGSAAALALLRPQLTPAQQAIADFMQYMSISGDTRVKEVLDPPGAGQIATSLQAVAVKIGSGKTSVSDGAKEFFAAAQKATAS
jgi:multiple sugar transport system substrate-binding protein